MGAFSEYAERYLAKGYSVIPIRAGDKKPAISEWSRFCHELPLPDQVESWIRFHPEAGIGLCCGPQSGVVGFDLDVEPSLGGPHKVIYEAIQHLLPQSPIGKRGAKGDTRLFRFNGEESVSIKKSFGSASGSEARKSIGVIDLLSAKRQMVLPPSIHPTTGVPYIWSNGHNLLDINVNDLPILDPENIAKIRSEVSRLALFLNAGDSHANDTGRNNQLKAMAAAAIHNGKGDAEIANELLEYDIRHHSPPLFQDASEGMGLDQIGNARRFVRNIRRSLNINEPKSAVRNAPTPLFPPVEQALEYPLHALGGVLGQAAADIQHVTQAPAAICGQSVLAAAALAVQPYKTAFVDGRAIPLSLFALTVAVSGERKSAVDGWALKAHREFERHLLGVYKEQRDEYEDTVKIIDIEKRKALEKSSKDPEQIKKFVTSSDYLILLSSLRSSRKSQQHRAFSKF